MRICVPCNFFYQKITRPEVFSIKGVLMNFEKFLRTPFLHNTSGDCFCPKKANQYFRVISEAYLGLFTLSNSFDISLGLYTYPDQERLHYCQYFLKTLANLFRPVKQDSFIKKFIGGCDLYSRLMNINDHMAASFDVYEYILKCF